MRGRIHVSYAAKHADTLSPTQRRGRPRDEKEECIKARRQKLVEKEEKEREEEEEVVVVEEEVAVHCGALVWVQVQQIKKKHSRGFWSG